uniref:Uncharacterized protein n=1 Tax=Alexandrium andersonii TaxID=327968 RepID=A0A7S2NC77_9DINO
MAEAAADKPGGDSEVPPGFYFLDDCRAFNYDSDVDEGEDEIELKSDGTAKRELMHKRSWVDGGGNKGSDVRRTSGKGRWKQVGDEVHVDWKVEARHKGAQPEKLSVIKDGSLMFPCSYKKRYYQYSTTSSFKG